MVELNNNAESEIESNDSINALNEKINEIIEKERESPSREFPIAITLSPNEYKLVNLFQKNIVPKIGEQLGFNKEQYDLNTYFFDFISFFILQNKETILQKIEEIEDGDYKKELLEELDRQLERAEKRLGKIWGVEK